MLVLVFLFIAFFFLVLGALQFLLCVAIPSLRKYALSAALWWAVWGPCMIALLTLAGLGVVAASFIQKDDHFAHLHAHRLPMVLGWGYVILGTIVTVAVATSVAWLHQAVVRRFPFALFRIYATLVTAGIGSVFGWCLGWWILDYQIRFGWARWIFGMVVLIGGFGTVAFKAARSLRGKAPTKFAWLTPKEFEGT